MGWRIIKKSTAMKSLLILTCILLVSFYLYAQKTCDQNELSSRPGKWKESKAKGSLYEVTPKEAAAEQATLNNISGMIKAGYTPQAVVAMPSNIIGYNPAIGANWIANPFAHFIPFRKYLCLQGKEYVNGEMVVDVKATLFIYANSMEWIANIYPANFSKDNENGYVYMQDMPVVKDGFYYYNLNPEAGAEPYEAVLITKDNALPFKYVSKKEFLLIRKTKLEKKKQTELDATFKSSIIRSAAEQEAAKQKEIASLKKENYSQPYIDRFLKDYQTDEQKRDAAINRVAKYFNDPIKLISTILTSSSETELAKPAIIKGQETYDIFTGFVSDAEGICLVKPNLDYYNSNLAKSAPQFFTVFYKWDDKNPVYDKTITDLKKSINLQTLKNMIVK